MSDQTTVKMILSFGPEPEQLPHLQALESMAFEAGCMRGGLPSLSCWLQHVADLKIRADQAGRELELSDIVGCPGSGSSDAPVYRSPRPNTTISLGRRPEGRERERALLDLAAQTDCIWKGKPSISLLVQYLADMRMIKDRIGYRPSLTPDANGEPAFLTFRCDMLRRTAQGDPLPEDPATADVLDAGRARDLLRAYGVPIPEDAPIRHDVEYALGDSEEARAHNRRLWAAE